MMKKRIVNLWALLLAVTAVQAQSFTHSLALPKIDSSGFYEIELPVELFSVCNKKQGDIRIYEAGTKNQTPYILRNGSDIDLRFIDTIISVNFEVKSKQKNRYEIFIPPFDEVNFSLLKFNYSTHGKSITKTSVQVSQLLNNNRVETVSLDIKEENDSTFILSHGTIRHGQATRIVFENVDANFAITSISYQKQIENNSVFTKMTHLVWENTENTVKKTSVIKGSLLFNTPVQKMEIEIDSTGYYNRHGNLQLFTEKPRNLFDDNHRSSISLNFNEGNKISVDVNNIMANRFLITINNKDNKPLPIKSITAYSPKLYAIAKLEAGKQYVLMAGNPTLKAPQYDWNYNYKVPKNHRVVADAALQPIAENENNNGILLWGAVGLSILVMGGMAFSMIKRTTVE